MRSFQICVGVFKANAAKLAQLISAAAESNQTVEIQNTDKACIVGWVETYFKDCLCNIRDEISFVFGLVSLICWGVAEIPQIITNFRTKSGHGISIFFLLTWILGYIFNLMGCILEPATLPTPTTARSLPLPPIMTARSAF